MTQLDIDGANLGYDDRGAGAPVVLIHGDAADRRMWDPVAAALAASHRVVWYDRRGYGESTDPSGPVRHHQDLIELLDALEIPQAVLVGCSAGGTCALDVTLSAPHRVSALGLVSSGASGHVWPDSLATEAAEFVGGVVDRDRLDSYRTGTADVRDDDVQAMAVAQARFLIAGPDRDPSDVDPGVWQLSVDMLEQVFRREWSRAPVDEIRVDPPAVARLAEVGVPALVVNGLRDVPAIQQLAAVLVAGLPDVTLVDLPDTAHTPPLERPAEVAVAITDLVDRAVWR